MMMLLVLLIICTITHSCASVAVTAAANAATPTFDFDGLPLDKAAVRFTQTTTSVSPVPSDLLTDVYWVSSVCYECSYTWFASFGVSDGNSTSVTSTTPYYVVDTRWSSTFFFGYNTTMNMNMSMNMTTVQIVGQMEYQFSEKGGYDVQITSMPAGMMSGMIMIMDQSTVTDSSPINSFVPIYVALAVLIVSGLLWAYLFYPRVVVPFLAYLGSIFSVSSSDRVTFPPATTEYTRSYMSRPLLSPSEFPDPTVSASSSHSHSHSHSSFVNFETVPGAGAAPAASSARQASSRSSKTGASRLRSLDTFRGFSLCIMIFVNYGGGGYWFFSHSLWNGLTVADLVFPWFMWMMGVSMALASSKKSNIPFTVQFYRIFRRSAILLALGLFVNNGFDTYNWRIMGVLQRFGVSYFFVSLIAMLRRGGEDGDVNVRQGETTTLGPVGQFFRLLYSTFIGDLAPHVYEVLVVLLFIFVHLIITFTLRVSPDCPLGYLGPGGLSQQSQHKSCVGGAARRLDELILGETHMYHGPTCINVIRCVDGDAHPDNGTGVRGYDPEGLLGCFTSVAMTYFGLHAGRILLRYRNYSTSHHNNGANCGYRQVLARWFIWSVVLGSIALGLSGGTRDGGAIPVNKNLWSLSFITALTSMGLIGLGICYVLVDVLGVWNGAPFVYTGMNSIMVYMGSECLSQRFPFSYYVANSNRHAPLLVQNIVGVASWMVLAFYAYECDFFIAV